MTVTITSISLPQLSNQDLLKISATLFFLFVVAEMIGAIVSNSLSLLGDASSTVVDVGTYICNIYAEWAKQKRDRWTNRMKLVLEVVIPAVSVGALLIVTMGVIVEAITVLNSPPSVDDVDVDYLYGFAAANLVVDLVCTGLFFLRAEDVFIEAPELPSLEDSACYDLYEDIVHFDTNVDIVGSSNTADQNQLKEGDSTEPNHDCKTHCLAVFNSYCGYCNFHDSQYRRPSDVNINRKSFDYTCNSSKKNLNMMSAFAHVVGDMLRTIAIFIAAMVSSFTQLDGDLCDAWAALVVAGTIVFLCVSLIIEIVAAALEIWHEVYVDPPPRDDFGGVAQFTERSTDKCIGGNSIGDFMLLEKQEELNSSPVNENYDEETVNAVFSSVDAAGIRTAETYSFVSDELQPCAAILQSEDRAPEIEGVPEWQVSRSDYLHFLVDSLSVYETLEDIVEKYPELSAFRDTGLERSEALRKDIKWLSEEYDPSLEVPTCGEPGQEYAKLLYSLVKESLPKFMCHYYNHYFAHTAGGMIGKRMSDQLLEGRTLEFYKWERAAAAAEAAGGKVDGVKALLGTVQSNIDEMARTWSDEERQQCCAETMSCFKYGGSLMSYMRPKRE